MKSIDESLKSAVFLYNGELYDTDTLLEGFLKRNKQKKTVMEAESKPVQATILTQCVCRWWFKQMKLLIIPPLFLE